MSGSYGFSINVEITPNDTTNLIERVQDFLDGNSNEEQILKDTLLDEETEQIVFFGDHEEEWRHPYGREVIDLLNKLKVEFGGHFTGELIWYTYDYNETTIETWSFDGNGEMKYDVDTEEEED